MVRIQDDFDRDSPLRGVARWRKLHIVALASLLIDLEEVPGRDKKGSKDAGTKMELEERSCPRAQISPNFRTAARCPREPRPKQPSRFWDTQMGPGRV